MIPEGRCDGDDGALPIQAVSWYMLPATRGGAMSEWEKFAMTWMVSILIGFYSVFVLTELWNWFVVPLLHVPEARYWLMYGVTMLFGLMAGADLGAGRHSSLN